MAIVKYDRTGTEMPLGIDPFPGAPPVFSHAGVRPPQAAAPLDPVRSPSEVWLLVPNEQVLSGASDARPFELLGPHKVDAPECDPMTFIWVLTEEKAVVSITDLMAIEFPSPPDAVISAPSGQGRTPEHIALIPRISNDGGSPPVCPTDHFRCVVNPLVTVPGERIIVIVRVQLKEQRDLLEVVKTMGPLALGSGLCQRRQKHASQNGDDGDHNEKFNQGKTRCFPEIRFRSHKKGYWCLN